MRWGTNRPPGSTAVDLDALLAAAGELEVRGGDVGQEVLVPVPGTGTQVRVRLRAADGGWLLDDGGDTTERSGAPVAAALPHLRCGDAPLRLEDGRVTCGAFDGDEVAPAVLRFAMVLHFLPVAASVADVAASVADVAVGAGGTAAPSPDAGRPAAGGADPWEDDAGDWGTEDLRESARRFQEDALRRWAG
jgi:hypothetical protein